MTNLRFSTYAHYWTTSRFVNGELVRDALVVRLYVRA